MPATCYILERPLSRDSSRYDADANCDYALPLIACPGCREAGDYTVAYTAFDLTELPDLACYAPRQIVSPERFAELAKPVVLQLGLSLPIVPMAGLGPQTGEVGTTRLDDFVWGAHPMISEAALEKLEGRGFRLPTGGASLTCRGKPVSSHRSLHLEPVPLLTDQARRSMECVQCGVCGSWEVKAAWRKLEDLARSAEVVAERLPQGRHLIQVLEHGVCVVTPAFKEAVESLELSGCRFMEYGVWV
jgi:hypothetical protein